MAPISSLYTLQVRADSQLLLSGDPGALDTTAIEQPQPALISLQYPERVS